MRVLGTIELNIPVYYRSSSRSIRSRLANAKQQASERMSKSSHTQMHAILRCIQHAESSPLLQLCSCPQDFRAAVAAVSSAFTVSSTAAIIFRTRP